MAGSGKGGFSPTGEITENARTKVARGVDRPSFEIASTAADHGHEQADDQGTRIGLRGLGVIFLGDREDAKQQETRQHDLVEEGPDRRDVRAGRGKEHARSAAGRPVDALRRVERVNHRRKHHVDDRSAQKCANRLGDPERHDLALGEASIDCERESDSGIGMCAGHRARHVDRDRNGKAPGDAHPEIGRAVRAGIIQKIHRGCRTADGDDNENCNAFGDQFSNKCLSR